MVANSLQNSQYMARMAWKIFTFKNISREKSKCCMRYVSASGNISFLTLLITCQKYYQVTDWKLLLHWIKLNESLSIYRRDILGAPAWEERSRRSVRKASASCNSPICMASLLLLLGAIMKSHSNDLLLIEEGTKESNCSNSGDHAYEPKDGNVFSGDYLWNFPTHRDFDGTWKLAEYGIWPWLQI